MGSAGGTGAGRLEMKRLADSALHDLNGLHPDIRISFSGKRRESGDNPLSKVNIEAVVQWQYTNEY
jgi:hypothetical protein